MVAYRAGGSIGLTILLAAVASAAARGQDPAPAELTPQAVLKGHNLVRSGTTWILGDEKAVLKDLRDAQDVYRQVAQGMMSQQELEFGAQNRQDALLQLRERSAVLDQSIAEFDVQLNALVAPPGGNNFVQQQHDMLSQQRNLLVAEHNQVVNQLNTLQEQQNKDQGQDQKLQLNAEVAQSREKYIQAVLDLRKSVDELTAKYDELLKNPAVAKALEAPFHVDQEQAEAGRMRRKSGTPSSCSKGPRFRSRARPSSCTEIMASTTSTPVLAKSPRKWFWTREPASRPSRPSSLVESA